MSIYQFSAPSPIAGIRFRAVPNRMPVALIEAAESADPMLLAGVMQGMQQKGWQALPVFADGKEQLQVTGFKEDNQVIQLLQTARAVNGTPKVLSSADEQEIAKKGWILSNKLRAAGLLNFIGDALLLGAGIQKKDKLMTLAGGLYTGGALTLARYGDVRTERQLQEVAQGTAQVLQNELKDLPQGTALSSAAQMSNAGLFHRVDGFLYRNPANVMLTAYTAGAAAMLGSGITSGNKARVGYGVWSLGVKAASLLLPEKKAKPEKKEKPATGIGSVAEWVHEKPLRIFGYGSMITEVLLGASVLADYKKSSVGSKERMSAMLGFGTTGAYILSDFLMALSNKDPTNAGGKFDTDEQRRLEAMAAEAISRAPKRMQADLIQKSAAYMAENPEVSGTVDTIQQSIAEQVAHLQQNPWTARVVESQQEPQLTLNR